MRAARKFQRKPKFNKEVRRTTSCDVQRALQYETDEKSRTWKQVHGWMFSLQTFLTFQRDVQFLRRKHFSYFDIISRVALGLRKLTSIFYPPGPTMFPPGPCIYVVPCASLSFVSGPVVPARPPFPRPKVPTSLLVSRWVQGPSRPALSSQWTACLLLHLWLSPFPVWHDTQEECSAHGRSVCCVRRRWQCPRRRWCCCWMWRYLPPSRCPSLGARTPPRLDVCPTTHAAVSQGPTWNKCCDHIISLVSHQQHKSTSNLQENARTDDHG